MNNELPTRVVVTDIRMPFWSMVRFMVKWAIAAIPALIILALIGTALSLAMTSLMGHYTSQKMVRLEGAPFAVDLRVEDAANTGYLAAA